MPVTLRTRPICHYCNKRTNPLKKDERKFKCGQCLAINFLDENGDIMDVPPEFAAPEVGATWQTNIDTGSSFSSQDSIFCSTCLKNQYLYTAALSEYLPDPADPNYGQCEAALPVFKCQLEQRYPQCCQICEPKVRAKLQKTTYHARSDHLRRVLEKSRTRRLASAWGWRSLLITAAGLGYASSLLVQLSWHVFGLHSSPDFEDENPSIMLCLSYEMIPRDCPLMVQRLIGWSLVIGLLCVWWNPKWQHKLHQTEGRLVGLDQYYQLQLFLLTIRFGIWMVLTESPIPQKFEPMVHVLSAATILMTVYWSQLRTITIDNTPLVNWQQDPAELLSADQFLPPPHSTPPPNSQQVKTGFSVSNLNTPQRQTYNPWQPPTPPVEDKDAMDWAPTTNSFQPRQRPPKVNYNQPTPFYGALPAMPTTRIGQHRENKASNTPKALGLPPGFFDRPPPQASGILMHKDHTLKPILAQPKFFANDARADTGLENIFGKVFSLQDPAALIVQQSQVNPSSIKKTLFETSSLPAEKSSPNENGSFLNLLSILSFSYLLISLGTWSSIRLLRPELISIKKYVVLASTIVPTCNLAIAYPSIDMFGIFSNIFQITTLLVLSIDGFFLDLLTPAVWDKLGLGLLGFLLLQASWSIVLPSAGMSPQAVSRTEPSPSQSQPRPLSPQEEISQNAGSVQPWNLDGVSDERENPGTPPMLAFSPLQRRDSADSSGSDSSINTTSTASGWKTPKHSVREFDFAPRSTRSNASTVAFGFGGLGLGNSPAATGMGAGTGIAGSRVTRSRVGNNRNMGKREW